MAAKTDEKKVHDVSNEDSQVNKAERKSKGEFIRGISAAKNWIVAADSDEAKSASDDDKGTVYIAESGRYHLYVANNCPWCHRCVLTREVLGLNECISMDTCLWKRDEDTGYWQFAPELDKAGICTKDTVNGKKFVKEIYEMGGIDKDKSVPLLWDKKTSTVVNNESSMIIRMFATVFLPLAKKQICLYPYPSTSANADLRALIDDFNAWIYPEVNNGSYKAGFSSSQEKYEEAFDKYFAALDKLENQFAKTKFLCGDAISEADVRLFPTIMRHDPVYYVRFFLNKKMIKDYLHLTRWFNDMWGFKGIKEASFVDHCVKGYFGRTANRIIPKGPDLDWWDWKNGNK